MKEQQNAVICRKCGNIITIGRAKKIWRPGMFYELEEYYCGFCQTKYKLYFAKDIRFENKTSVPHIRYGGRLHYGSTGRSYIGGGSPRRITVEVLCDIKEMVQYKNGEWRQVSWSRNLQIPTEWKIELSNGLWERYPEGVF